MTFKFGLAALAAVGATLLTSSAIAQDAGPYVGVGVGFVDAPSTTVTDTASRSVKFDNGLMGSLALGYDYGSNWRAEVELSRRANDLDSVAGATAAGKMQATSLMANAIYDFDINSPVTPYLGAGLGFSQVKLKNASPFGASSINDSDRALAYQGIAGLSYAVNETIDLFADYRYFATRDLDVNTAAGTAASFDASTHSVMAGLRFNFGAPKPQMKPEPVAAVAPVAAPAPAPSLPKNYIVFFDWDKADITPESAAIIRTAASNAGAMKMVRLDLTGHADRSGTDAYNLKLSKRRADAVKAMFKDLGFKDNEISVVAKGETDPLVPTDDGVREPQNRRVEIVMP
ncbi:MAG: OmpA family protein [Rhodospirillales bacterium]|nr:OmpA family protein [Rhodospirillales bacterium]